MNTDLAELRQRLRKMPDQELLRFGIAAEFMCSAGSNCGHAPRQAFVMQFEEARAFPMEKMRAGVVRNALPFDVEEFVKQIGGQT